MSKNVDIFKSVLDKFETEELKLYCEDMIDKIDLHMLSIPSSTSLKYHNATQCQPGGNAAHILMIGTVMNHILSLEYIQEKFPKPKQRDCFRIAVLLHDALKTGGGEYTVHEHPMLASKWIRETHVEHDIDQKIKDYCGSLIESHSGQWATSNKSEVVLPKPTDDAHFLIHLCDYLSSRSDLDMIYTNEQKEAIRAICPPITPEEFTFKFGKYKGCTLAYIIKNDKDYLIWLRDKADMELREPLKSLIADL